MAIVFISPKTKQRAFIKTAIIVVGVVLIAVFLLFFISTILNKKLNNVVPISFTQPKVSINLSIVDSDKVKNLQPFIDLETEFSYVVKDKDGKQIEGNILAATHDDAKMLLEKSGFVIISLEQTKVGRTQPFMQY